MSPRDPTPELAPVAADDTADGSAPDDLRSVLHELRAYQEELLTQNEQLLLAQRELEASHQKYLDLFELAPIGYLALDRHGLLREINLTGSDLLGRPRARLEGKPFVLFVAGYHHDRFFAHLRAVFDGEQHGVELDLRHPQQGSLPAEVKSVPMRDDGGEVRICRSALLDISERRRTEEQLRLASQVLQASQEAVLIADRRLCITAVNPALLEMSGYREEELIGQRADLLRSNHHDPGFYQRILAGLHRVGRWRGQVWGGRKNGTLFPAWVSISTLRDEAGRVTHYVATASDITDRERARQRVQSLAYYDALTGLPNRTLFGDRLAQAIAGAHRYRNHLGLLILDLDRFKLINDALGHAIGDHLICEAARRLSASVREADTVGRLGGDEFGVLLPNIRHVYDATAVASEILAALSRPFPLEERQYFVGASIGVCQYPEDGADTDTLVRNADAAMYRAKEAGRNTYQVFRAEMNDAAAERLELASALREALEHGHFAVHYQPQVALQNGCVVGMEALVRLHHPVRGLVPPMDFIPVAEETGLIVPIGYHVLAAACGRMTALRAIGFDQVRLAVNLSPQQFMQSDLCERVLEVVKDSGLPPHCLELEVTESGAMPDMDYSVRTLRRLREQGIQIALDDFGTGFSSLSHLRHLPVDKLKIDRSFVRGIPDDPEDTAIASTIIHMAHSLRLLVVAEGVETEAQMGFLAKHGCQQVQGYLTGRPLPEERLPEALARTYGGMCRRRHAQAAMG
jgi:diguanylate cyclase (GGDEF)-like protein/PAS domain S-box-containing protein